MSFAGDDLPSLDSYRTVAKTQLPNLRCLEPQFPTASDLWLYAYIFTMLKCAKKPEVQMLIIYEKIRLNSRNKISIPPSIRIYRLFSHKI